MKRKKFKGVVAIAISIIVVLFLISVASMQIAKSSYEDDIYDMQKQMDTLRNNLDSLIKRADSMENEIMVYKRAKLSNMAGMKIPKSFTDRHINFLEDVCDEYNIPIKIAARLIYVESSYNKNALSYVGASGYMQLMPYTYNHFASILNISRFNDFSNIRVGLYYLKHLYKIYNRFSELNRWKLTLLSYNMGPTKVRKNPSKYLKVASQYSYVKKILRI